jgi:hypothetical protein
MRNWRNYSDWQLGDSFGYVDASYNYNGLVGFINNQVAGEKKITKINNLSYLQRTKKLALTAVGGTDFSYNSGFYTLSPGNTNTTYLKANDFYQADLQYGYTIHAKFSVDSDASQNVRLLSLRSPSILRWMKNSFQPAAMEAGVSRPAASRNTACGWQGVGFEAGLHTVRPMTMAITLLSKRCMCMICMRRSCTYWV